MKPLENLSRLLLCPGELRPDLMKLFGAPPTGIDCLLSAPGVVQSHPGHSALVDGPSQPLSSAQASKHRRAVLRDFDRAVDRLPRTEDWESLIQRWIVALDSGDVDIRHADRLPLHTRLVSKKESTALPHAPLTVAASKLQNELTVEMTGAQHERARAWFERRFEDAVDMSPDVQQHLVDSWAGGWSSPEEIYYKVLSEYFEGVVSGLDSAPDDNPMIEHLTEFQHHAYVYAKTILQRFGGVILADVVGLGKTYIALALLKHLQRRYGEHAVVVAPPAVLDAWKSLAHEFRVELAFVSLGKLEDLDKYRDREILVVDESHHFRNEGTQRYEKLNEWLRPGGASSARKVLLLSATPQNNSASDVKSQLLLFPDNFTRIPYRGESLDAWFREVSAGTASLVDMLQHVVVRRTRHYIRSAHPNATIRMRMPSGQYEEKPLHFPERISGEEQTLRYSLDETYGAAFYAQLLDAIATMKYPLHGLGQYVLESAADDRVLRRLRATRGSSLRGLFKVLLLKRLESSTVALDATLRRFETKLKHAHECLLRGVVIVGHRQLSDDDADDALSLKTRGESEIQLAQFDAAQLQADIEADLATVSKLLAGTATLNAMGDPKVRRLCAYLDKRPPTKHRTLIFTQFADTATHLGEVLGSRFGRTAVVTGSTGSVLKTARRFAPRASRRDDIKEEEELDLLISTDVLSEGVNLQDADTLINYDLHWNPVRLIQRAGRIDRIGTQHEEIHVSSFLPERTLEANLGLEAVLRRRIAEFVAVFGEDSHVLPGHEKIEEEQVLATYTGEALNRADGSDDLDGISRHVERLLTLRREEPEQYHDVLNLRLGRRAVGGPRPSLVAMRRSWFWAFWRSDEAKGLVNVDALQAFDLLLDHVNQGSVEQYETRASLPLLEEVSKAFDAIAEQAIQQRMYPRLSAGQAFVLDQIKRYASTAPPASKARVTDIILWVRRGRAQSMMARAGRQWKKAKLSPRAVFEETARIWAGYPGQDEDSGEAQLVAAMFDQR